MGKRGPAPRPTALKLLNGDRESRINREEPIPRDALPIPPRKISDDVREIWDYTLRELNAMGIAAAADRDALVCYCEAVVTHRKASEMVAASTVLVKGLHGGLVRNPALAIQRDAAHTIRALAQEFGLTPSARTRIRADEALAVDPKASNPFAVVN